MSPDSNSSNTNTNTNVESPSSITSPILGPMSQNISTDPDLENPGNGNQILSGGGLVSQQSWSPRSEEEQTSTSPGAKSPSHGITPPHNSGQSSTSPYRIMQTHPNMTHYGNTMKTEMSPPANESQGLLPSYPMNGSLTSLGMSGEVHQVPSYGNSSSLHQHQSVPHPSMISTSFWYPPGSELDQNGMNQQQHVDHRSLNDSAYLK